MRVAMIGHRGPPVTWINVFWANLSGGAAAPQADLDAWTLAFYNAYKARLQAQLDNLTGVDSAQAVLFTSGGTALHSIQGVPYVGTLAGTATSNNEPCRVISWDSGAYWRGGKPRTYLPGGIESAITSSNQWSAGTKTAVQAAAALFRTDVNALSSGAITGTQLGFVSFVHGKVDRVPPVFYPFTAARMHSRIGTQRRRLGKWLQ